MPKKSTAEIVLETLKPTLDSIQSRLTDLENKPVVQEPEIKQTITTTETQTTENKLEVSSKFPIPQQYREYVNNILNKDFGIAIDYPDSSPQFHFSLIVPKKYSDATPDYLKMYGQDVRMKVIPNSEGFNGVKEYVDLVWKRFNPDTQALITNDRLK